MNPPPISSGWANDSKSGPVPAWALWFQNLHIANDTGVTVTNITHGGVLTNSMSVTKMGRVVTVILTISDTVSTSSTLGTTKFSLSYKPTAITPAITINATTLATLGNGYVSTDGNLYSPTFTTTAGQSVVMTVTYFTAD